MAIVFAPMQYWLNLKIRTIASSYSCSKASIGAHEYNFSGGPSLKNFCKPCLLGTLLSKKASHSELKVGCGEGMGKVEVWVRTRVVSLVGVEETSMGSSQERRSWNSEPGWGESGEAKDARYNQGCL